MFFVLFWMILIYIHTEYEQIFSEIDWIWAIFSVFEYQLAMETNLK